jgi:hypothetical protein
LLRVDLGAEVIDALFLHGNLPARLGIVENGTQDRQVYAPKKNRAATQGCGAAQGETDQVSRSTCHIMSFAITAYFSTE